MKHTLAIACLVIGFAGCASKEVADTSSNQVSHHSAATREPDRHYDPLIGDFVANPDHVPAQEIVTR